MAPRPTSRCCRAVYGGLACPSSSNPVASATTQSNSVWITDLVLASAFTAYCRNVSGLTSPGTARRFASNVPGPLESRRRLGKRQMTDQLNLQLTWNAAGAAPPPIWALSNAPDLRQWQWTPPRDAVQGLLRQADPAVSGKSLFPLEMPEWLTELGREVVKGAHAVEEPQHRKESVAAQQLYTKLEAWRRVVTNQPETAFKAQLDNICDDFQTQLCLALLTVEDARSVFCQIWAVLHERRVNREAHAPVLFAAALQGIRTCPLLEAQDFGAAFWRQLYVNVAQLWPWDHHAKSRSALAATATMALDTLLATPPCYLADVADLLPLHLYIVLVSHAARAHTDPSIGTIAADEAHMHALAKDVARALRHVDLETQGSFIHATTQLLMDRLSSSPSLTHTDSLAAGVNSSTVFATDDFSSNVATTWLLVLAHMPQVRQDFLYKTMSQLQQTIKATQSVSNTGAIVTSTTTMRSSSTTCHMRRVDLCELLLAQWISRGYVTVKAQKLFQRTLGAISAQDCQDRQDCRDGQDRRDCRDHPAALAALALAVFWPKHSRFQCVALYLSLLRGLQALGGDAAAAKGDLLLSVTALVEFLQTTPATPSVQTAATQLKLPPAAFFESLAWAMDDVHAAISLHQLYASTNASVGAQMLQGNGSGPVQQPALWSMGFWDKYADQLAAALDSGDSTPSQVCYVLDLPARAARARRLGKATQAAAAASLPKSTKATFKPAKGLSAPIVALVEKLAVHFALDRDMGPRQSLRGVEHCWNFLAAHGRRAKHLQERGPPTSPSVLRALFYLITRDLEDAMPGRTSRLRWFLGIVEREYSPAEARISGHALERWRASAKQLQKAKDWQLLQEARDVLDKE
ncbi:hypothetical protein SEPCBS119000_004185 [Sporothrix epigloea]|uniref:Uncharacterized protein n=1 Tax=Sporothrix epigloea TaxID=1892477 RepID=A0ABP0DSJ6_9PEZI